MRRNSFTPILRFFFCCFLAFSTVFAPQNSYAIFQGAKSGISFDYGKCMCNTGTIKFNPVVANDDIDWVLDNPTCAAFIGSVGAVLLTSDVGLQLLCTSTVNPANATAEKAADYAPPPPVPMITPGILVRLARKTTQCAARSGEYTAAQAAMAAACSIPVPTPACPGLTTISVNAGTTMGRCCGGVIAYWSALAVATTALAVIYDVARITYENARVCGNDWQQWDLSDELDSASHNIWKKGRGPYRKCIEQLFLNNGVIDANCSSYQDDNGNNMSAARNSLSVDNKFFREFIYGGREFEDNGDGACKNPSTWNGPTRLKNLGYTSDNQRYYMTGSGSAPAYACYRFVTVPKDTADREATQAAFDCCRRRSQNAICIENKSGLGDALTPYEHKFCEIGTRCTIRTVTFEIYASKKQSNYVCAKTYSLCPFDHLLGGGTEVKQMKTDDTSIVDNFCQFMNHCSKLPIPPYVRGSSLEGGYISSACRDMKGDSQNVYGYSSQLISIANTRGFSAPLVQCFKETMENIFLNKAGDTKCINPDELPSEGDVCSSGYIYRKGGDLPTPSFFIKIQNNLQDVIKMALSLSVAFFGIVTLFGAPNGTAIDKKRLYSYIVKIGLVMYFAVGDGWQYGFMKGLIRSSSYIAEVVFKNDESAADDKLDGCQFPRFNYADSNESTKYSVRQYPEGKDYLRMWDTLDCKIGRALGFGPEVSVPNLIFMILGGFLTGGFGIMFFIAAFAFAFFLISITVRAMHIFLLSITSVVLLMYVSPIAITASLFERSKDIFTKWRGQIIGFTLQPMILFCYLGVIITLFDKVVIGDDVTFTPSTVNIDGVSRVDTYGNIVPKQINCSGAASDTSLYCIFRVASISTFPGLEPLGIGLPMLVDMNEKKLNTIIKASILMFIFMSFMDKITTLAAALVGGAELKSDGISVATMAKKSYGALRGIQQRGMGAGKKLAGVAARKGISTAKAAGSVMLDRGKSSAPIKGPGPKDHTASSAAPAAADKVGSTTPKADSAAGAPKGDTAGPKK